MTDRVIQHAYVLISILSMGLILLSVFAPSDPDGLNRAERKAFTIIALAGLSFVLIMVR